MRTATPFLLATLALAACDDAIGPDTFGQPFALSTINAQPVPWESPLQSGYFITEGWITIIDDTTAERHERLENRIGDSVVTFGEWTYRGSWEQRLGQLTINYPDFRPGRLGPLNDVDTFFVAGDRLVLKESGYIPPLDTIVRVFCRTAAPC